MTNANGTNVVMVVDDEVLVRSELAAYLRDCGYRVVEAASTDEAMVVVREVGFRLDSILCDINVGGSMNGFQFAIWVREQRGLDVLLAGNLDKATGAAAQLCEKGPHLRRPYDPSSVADRIRQQLAARDRNRRGSEEG